MSSITKYGIEQNELNDIVSVFEKNGKIDSVLLFGSRAIGTCSKGSDIDLALKGDGLCLNDILDINIQIEKLFLAFKFDIIIYDRISEPALKEHIDRVGVLLLEKEK